MSDLTDRLRGKILGGLAHDHARQAADLIDRLHDELAASAQTIAALNQRVSTLEHEIRAMRNSPNRRPSHVKYF